MQHLQISQAAPSRSAKPTSHTMPTLVPYSYWLYHRSAQFSRPYHHTYHSITNSPKHAVASLCLNCPLPLKLLNWSATMYSASMTYLTTLYPTVVPNSLQEYGPPSLNILMSISALHLATILNPTVRQNAWIRRSYGFSDHTVNNIKLIGAGTYSGQNMHKIPWQNPPQEWPPSNPFWTSNLQCSPGQENPPTYHPLPTGCNTVRRSGIGLMLMLISFMP